MIHPYKTQNEDLAVHLYVQNGYLEMQEDQVPLATETTKDPKGRPTVTYLFPDYSTCKAAEIAYKARSGLSVVYGKDITAARNRVKNLRFDSIRNFLAHEDSPKL